MDRSELSEKVRVGVIIVTHNSAKTIDPVLESLKRQTLPPSKIYLIDSGSDDTHYIKKWDHKGPIEIALMPNIGFSAANNLGFNSLDKTIETILFLNPDCIITDDFLEKGAEFLWGRKDIGAVTGKMIGYDFYKHKPTDLLDSTGIFTTWYGKWYDRGQREPKNKYNQEESVPAICGALFYAKRDALNDILIDESEVFDERFFCYKEDIDLSLRLREKGWVLQYYPSLIAYHGRGWKRRSQVSRKLRVMSAENELKIHWKTKNPIKITYSFLKWVGVKFLNI